MSRPVLPDPVPPGPPPHRRAGAAGGTDDAVQVGEAAAALERLARWLHATYVAAQATSGAGQVVGPLWTRASAPLSGRLRSPTGDPSPAGPGQVRPCRDQAARHGPEEL